MAESIAADHGFTRTTSGEETTFQVRASKQYENVAKLRGCLTNGLIFILALIPGSIVGGNSNSGFKGLIATVVAFLVLRYAFKLLGKSLGQAFKVRTTGHTIVVSPTTVTINDRTYQLKDATDWHIGNSRDENTVVFTRASQTMTHDMMTKIAYYIAFHYGTEKVHVALNLTEAQANALLRELLPLVDKRA